MIRRERSELLELLNSNAAWKLPPYKRPEVNVKRLEDAVRTHAIAEDSDPFAAGRIRLHLTKGYVLPSDTIKEASARINRRAAEPKEALAVLVPVKKTLEANQAWNQHRTAVFIEGRA